MTCNSAGSRSSVMAPGGGVIISLKINIFSNYIGSKSSVMAGGGGVIISLKINVYSN